MKSRAGSPALHHLQQPLRLQPTTVSVSRPPTPIWDSCICCRVYNVKGREIESLRILSGSVLCLPISLITKPLSSHFATREHGLFRLLWIHPLCWKRRRKQGKGWIVHIHLHSCLLVTGLKGHGRKVTPVQPAGADEEQSGIAGSSSLTTTAPAPAYDSFSFLSP